MGGQRGVDRKGIPAFRYVCYDDSISEREIQSDDWHAFKLGG